MADKDEAESTDESSSALPADARDDAAAESEAASGDEVVDPEPADELVDPTIDDEAELEDRSEPDDPDTDEFDEIVRNSGVSDPDGDAADGDAKVLEPAGVGAAAVARSTSTGRPTPKGTPTSKRDQPAKREPRTTPVRFVRQSIGELRKVVYPTGEQLIKYFVVVLVFVLFIIAYVSLLDLGFGAAIFKIFA